MDHIQDHTADRITIAAEAIVVHTVEAPIIATLVVVEVSITVAAALAAFAALLFVFCAAEDLKVSREMAITKERPLWLKLHTITNQWDMEDNNQDSNNQEWDMEVSNQDSNNQAWGMEDNNQASNNQASNNLEWDMEVNQDNLITIDYFSNN